MANCMMQEKHSELFGESILDKYSVQLLSRAYRNLDEIYGYIREELFAEQAAENLIDKLEEAILSLETMPQRGARRRVGAYANKRYRQIFVENFIVVYRIDEVKKQVIIVTVRYSRSEF